MLQCNPSQAGSSMQCGSSTADTSSHGITDNSSHGSANDSNHDIAYDSSHGIEDSFTPEEEAQFII